MCRFLRPPSRGAAGRAICQVPPPLAPVQPVRPHPPLTDDRPRRAVREPPTLSAERSGPLVLFLGAAGFFVLAGAYQRCWRADTMTPEAAVPCCRISRSAHEQPCN